MKNRAIQRGALVGALVSAALLAGACEREWPEAGSDYEGRPNEAQELESFVEPDTAVEPPGVGGAGQAPSGPGDQDGLGDPDFMPGDERPPPERGESGEPLER